MAQSPEKKIRRRILVVQILMVLFIGAIGARAFDLQILKSDHLARLAENGYSRQITIKGERGQILDRHMNKLATSVEAVSITACPAQIKNPSQVAKQIAAILKIPQKPLEQTLSTGRMFAWVARKISPDQAHEIQKLNLHGIHFEKDAKRFYPNRDLAAQVIGFTGSEDSGLEGLEYKYNTILEGRKVDIRVKTDRTGRILDLNPQWQSILKGGSLVLTIDKRIQFLSEKALETTVKSSHAKSGIALVMDPKTGELLSMAHYPPFNPNNFGDYEKAFFRNRAVTDPFEPGSVMKVFTAAAALEKGFSPKSIFFCENGTYRIGTFTINDTHPHDWLSINQIIKVSSNIGAAKIVETIGNRTLHDYLIKFGFGRKTELGTPGETAGNLMHYREWSRMDASAISFGQGISVSAVQLISAISAVANNGMMMQPMLIKEVLSPEGDSQQIFSSTPVGQVIRPETAVMVKKMMNLAVGPEGTGTKAAMNGYTVCGKTGTAQKALENKRGYSNSRYTAVFAGFAPLQNPELAILVVVDEPAKQYHGGEVAAPVFKTIMAESFHYLNIPPEPSAMIALASAGGDE